MAGLAQTPLDEALNSLPASGRLRNCIAAAARNGTLPFYSVQEFLDASPSARQVLLSLPNFGRTTLKELETLLSEAANTDRLDSHHGYHCDVSALLADAQRILTERQWHVFSLREGYNGQEPQTLECIAGQFNVTRERIRQIQNQGLKVLRRSLSLNDYEASLARNEPAIWAKLTRRTGVVPSAIIEDRATELPDNIRLAIRVFYGHASDWAKHRGSQVNGLYVEPTIERCALIAAADTIRAVAATRKLPFPLHASIFPDIASELLIPAVQLIPGFTTYAGFLFAKNPTKRARRAVNAASLFQWPNTPRLIASLELWGRYRSAQFTDRCQPRDLEISLLQAPHLFLKVGGAWWVYLGPPLPSSPGNNSREATAQHQPTSPITEHNARRAQATFSHTGETGRIFEYLQTRGPSTFTDLAAAIDASKGSLAGRIAMEPKIVRLAPGVFGLEEHLEGGSVLDAYREKFLTELQCRLYAICRFAGERPDLYAGWGLEFEQLANHWAQEHCPGPVAESLLCVSEPGRWTTTDASKEYWQTKQRISTFSLHRPPDFSSTHTPLTPKQLLGTMLGLAQNKKLSWVGANRYCGIRIDSKSAIWPLAMLVMSGHLQASKDWMQAHELRTHPKHWIETFQQDLTVEGRLTWQSPSVRLYVNELLDAPPSPVAWVDESFLGPKLTQLIRAVGQQAEPVNEDTNSDLADILRVSAEREKVNTLHELVSQLLSDADI